MSAVEQVAFEFDTDAYHHVPVELLDPNPANSAVDSTRVLDTSDIDESIKRWGVQQAIRIRPTDGGRFEIIYGERRWRSSVKAGWPTIPAIIDTSDSEPVALVELRLIENLRKPLHPLDEGALYDELVDLGRTQKEIADLLGDKSQPFVSERLKIHRKLTTEAKAAFRAGNLKVKQAEQLADISPGLAADVVETANSGGDVDASLRMAIAEDKRIARVEQVTADLEAAGVKIRTESWLKGEMTLGATYGVMVDVEAHAAEPCHEAKVARDGKSVELLCVDRDRHRPSGASDLKASNLTDVADDEGANPIATFADDVERAAKPTPDSTERINDEARRRQAERDAAVAAERAQAEQLADAANRRLEHMQALVADTRSQTYALASLVDQMAHDDGLGNIRDQVAAALAIDLEGLTYDEQVDRIRAQAFAGDDGRTRFALALSWALGELRLHESQKYAEDESVLAASKMHLRRLVEHGYIPTAGEHSLLHGDEIDTPAAAIGDAGGTGAALAAAIDTMLAAAATLRTGPKGKSATGKANAAKLDEAKAAVVDLIVACVRDAEAFATELRTIDVTHQLSMENVGVVKDDADLRAFDAHRVRFTRAFIDAGVPLDEALHADGLYHVFRHTGENKGMPDWVRIGDILDALDVSMLANLDTRGPWLDEPHHCPACDAVVARYAEQYTDPGAPPAADYLWPEAPYLGVAGWRPAIASLDIDGPHGRLFVQDCDTRPPDATGGTANHGGALWQRGSCRCGFAGEPHHDESAAVRDALDHAWPGWRDVAGVDAGIPVELRELCSDGVCRGGKSEGGTWVVCANPAHEGESVSPGDSDDSATPDVVDEATAPVERRPHNFTKARLDALRVVGYGKALGVKVVNGRSTTAVKDLAAAVAAGDLTIARPVAEWLAVEQLAHRSAVDDSWWVTSPEGDITIADEQLLDDLVEPEPVDEVEAIADGIRSQVPAVVAAAEAARDAIAGAVEMVNGVPLHRFDGTPPGWCRACGDVEATDQHYDLDGDPVFEDIDPAIVCETVGKSYGNTPSNANGIECPRHCGSSIRTDVHGVVMGHLIPRDQWPDGGQ